MRRISGTQEPQDVPHFSRCCIASNPSPPTMAARISDSATFRQLHTIRPRPRAASGGAVVERDPYLAGITDFAAYAARIAGVRTRRIAMSFALFNILVLVSRTLQQFQG